MNRRSLALSITLCLALTACDTSDKEDRKPGSACKANQDKSYCTDMASKAMTCSQDKWVEISCDDGKCIYTADGVACKSKEGCEDGTNSCANNGLVKHCQDGIWSYTSCDMGMSCNDGVCSKDTQEELDYLVSRRCTKDNKGIIETYTDKEITTTCLKEVGFASSCKQFSSEQAGCVLPSACDATFSSEGTCFGDKLAFCEDERIIPAPAVIDCASLGKTCAKLNGKSYCLDKCAQEDELSCVKKDGIERPSRCKIGRAHV